MKLSNRIMTKGAWISTTHPEELVDNLGKFIKTVQHHGFDAIGLPIRTMHHLDYHLFIDYMEEISQAVRESAKNIKLFLWLNCLMNIFLPDEWCCVDDEGHVTHGNVCTTIATLQSKNYRVEYENVNLRYIDALRGIVSEISKNNIVDGVHLIYYCFQYPCWCKHCRKKFALRNKKYMIYNDKALNDWCKKKTTLVTNLFKYITSPLGPPKCRGGKKYILADLPLGSNSICDDNITYLHGVNIGTIRKLCDGVTFLMDEQSSLWSDLRKVASWCHASRNLYCTVTTVSNKENAKYIKETFDNKSYILFQSTKKDFLKII